MIGSIGSTSFQPSIGASSSSSTQASLSLEQQQVIEDTLLNYDANSLSAEDASAIVSAFQDAGIKPSKELADTMGSLGFSAQEVGQLAGVQAPQGGMPPPPPPPSEEEFDTVSTLIDSLFNSDEDEDSTSTISFDDVMDYTSRVLSLNDESKQKVMELFESYSSDNTELSSSDAANVVSNTLSQILNDSNNYKRTSFYA